MKKKIQMIVSIIVLTVALVACTEGKKENAVYGDDGRINVLYSNSDLEDYEYTILEEKETGCKVLVVRDWYNGMISSSVLKCDEQNDVK